MARFITFEGGEGSGKSTQARLLLQKLEARHVPAMLTRDPGGTAVGDELRTALKRKQGAPIAPRTELFLFAASRAQLVAEVIRPALEAGKAVLCDRFTHSTTVYQGYGRGLDLSVIELVNNMATMGLSPDLIVLLDIMPEQGLTRKRSLDDRFELEDLPFHRRVRDGYLKLAAAEPDRWLVIDASLPRDEVAGTIWERVSLLSRRFSDRPLP